MVSFNVMADDTTKSHKRKKKTRKNLRIGAPGLTLREALRRAMAVKWPPPEDDNADEDDDMSKSKG